MRLYEITDDPKFNSMLGKIVSSQDTKKYDTMMHGITEPKSTQGPTIFHVGDDLLDDLEDLILYMPIDEKKRLANSYDKDPSSIGDWMEQTLDIPIDKLSAIQKAIRDHGGFNLIQFFACEPDEFNEYLRQPWEHYKLESM